MIYPKLMLRKFEIGLNNFSAPFLETLQSYQTKDIIIGIGLFLAISSALACLCNEALTGGDAAVYLQQMKELNFSNRSVHIGYYLLGAGFIRIIPGSDDRAINMMNCFLGAMSVAILYFIAFTISHKHIAAIFSSLFLLTHHIFLENSLYAEVYTPQVCFLLLAILLWLLDRPIIASLSFALSLLISTSAILALPLFFILRPRLRPLLLFCAISLVIAFAAIVPVYRDYFFGARGLFTIALHQAFSLGFILRREAGEVFFNFFLCIPFVVVGLAELFGRKRFRPLALALLSLWLASLFLGEKNWNDFSVQFPTYALLCLVGGLGFHLLLRISNNKPYGTILSAIMLLSLIAVVVLIKVTKTPAQISVFLPVWFLVAIISCAVLCMLVTTLPRLRRIRPQVIIVGAIVFAVVTNGFVAFSKLRTISRYHIGYRDTIIEVSKVGGPEYVIVGHWSQRILFEHYVFQKSYTSRCISIDINALAGSAGKEEQTGSAKKLNEAIAARRQILVLGNYSGLLQGLQRADYKIAQFRYVYIATARN
jgi:hypothetical protein